VFRCRYTPAGVKYVKMTEQEILQIIEIDQLNMSKFFSDSGKVFDVELRKTGIEKEVDKGAVFLLVKENQRVIGYVEYLERKKKKVTIKSVQIHPSKSNGFTLRKFIKGIYPKFKGSYEEHQIISAAHRNNRKSISLHERFGFVVLEIENDMLTYGCKGIEFIKKLEKFITK
jgi:L-amino acid N-acyltransferase YncA